MNPLINQVKEGKSLPLLIDFWMLDLTLHSQLNSNWHDTLLFSIVLLFICKYSIESFASIFMKCIALKLSFLLISLFWYKGNCDLIKWIRGAFFYFLFAVRVCAEFELLLPLNILQNFQWSSLALKFSFLERILATNIIYYI